MEEGFFFFSNSKLCINRVYLRVHRVEFEAKMFFVSQFLLCVLLAHLRVSYCDWSVVRRPSVRPFTITKKSSSPKLTIRFQSNFTEIILTSCSFKRLQRIEFREELWLPWQQSEKNFKNLLVPNHKG